MRILLALLLVATMAIPIAERMTPHAEIDDIALRAAQHVDEAPRSTAYQRLFVARADHAEKLQRRRAVAAIERRSRNVPAIG